MKLVAGATVGLMLVLCHGAIGATIRVPLDQPTIQAGIDSASAFDIVLVAPGTYTGTGNRDIDFRGKRITVRSEAGAASTVIDAEYLGRGFYFHTAETPSSILEGFTIQHGGYPSDPYYSAGAIYVVTASPTIRACVMRDAVVRFGGAVLSSFGGPRLIGCRFENNTVTQGGAIFSWGGTLSAQDCSFVANYSSGWGAVMAAEDATTMTFTRCTFVGNSGFGVIHTFAGTTVTLNNCTLAANAIRGEAAVRLEGTNPLNLSRTIIAFNEGRSVLCYGFGSISCCDIYGNAGGDYVSCIQSSNGVSGNVALDPLFCNLAGGDVTLQATSPCAPGNSPGGCGLVGALPVACGVSAIEAATWGSVKAQYR